MARPAAMVALISIGVGSLALGGAAVPETSSATPASGSAVGYDRDRRERGDWGDRSSRHWARTATPAATPVPGLVTPSPGQATPGPGVATPYPTRTAPEPRGTAPSAKPSPSATTTRTTTPKPRPTPSRTATGKPATTQPAPVGGLNQTQMNHAATIVKVGQDLGLPTRAYVIAIATALQESTLRNLANATYPASMGMTREGVGADHDSLGLFQQRVASGWGTVQELMTPSVSARKFYNALSKVAGWQNMSLAAAAQAVQVSAFPDAYARHESLATQVVNALT